MSIAPYPKRGLVVLRHDPARIVGRMTLDEYVAFERDSLEKHELLDGEVVRMAGGSPEHNRISFDAGRTFAEAFDTTRANCEIYGSDQKVYISRKLAYYPDVTIVCGDAQFDERLWPYLRCVQRQTLPADDGERSRFATQIRP